MQQELWLRARAQVLSSLKTVCAMRAASDPHGHGHHLVTTEAGVRSAVHTHPGGVANGVDHHHHHSHGSPRTSHLKSRSSGHALAHANSHINRDGVGAGGEDGPEAFRTFGVLKDGAGGEEGPEAFRTLHKSSRSHQELHKELLLAHKKGLVVSSRPELQMVLERRRKEQSQKQEEEQAMGPLDHVLQQRQQRTQEKAREEEERVRDEAHLSEFVRVRQNLRKIHSALQNKHLDHNS